jgi:hypothetical protein
MKNTVHDSNRLIGTNLAEKLIAACTLTGLLSCVVALPTAAQTVQGMVKDMGSGAAIADASVVLLDDRGQIQRGTLSEPDGSFVIQAPGGGRYVLRVGAAGFATKDSPEFEIEGNGTAELTVLLISDAATGGPPGFDQRRAQGKGIFLTREDIENASANLFTEVLRYVPGVTVVPLPPSANTGRPPSIAQTTAVNTQDSVELARGGRAGYNTVRVKPDRATAGVTHIGEGPSDCIPVLYVNGAWWGPIDEASDAGPDGKFVPTDIEAIEIYNHPSVLPQQFNSGREAEECGVVVLWMISR